MKLYKLIFILILCMYSLQCGRETNRIQCKRLLIIFYNVCVNKTS